MTRHLNYNPGRDAVEYLEAINCGNNRLQILDQLLISLHAEKDRPNHQHHLLIGPRGSGKTHLLRILTAGRIPADPSLAGAYLPLVMPEETPLRTPGDLLLKFVERLADQLGMASTGLDAEKARIARTDCLNALTIAKGVKDPLDRLSLMSQTLETAGETINRVLLPIAENIDQTFYLGTQGSRKSPRDEQWALRRYFQEARRLMLIGAAPAIFGAVGDPGKAFYDFFRTHHLSELTNDEVLEIIHRRLEYERKNPCADPLRRKRIASLMDRFQENTPQLRGIIAVTGGIPRFVHLIYEVMVDTDVHRILDTLNRFLDDLTPYFQNRLDPRFIPQAEIDVLHTLASARGPLQPSEIAEELYGVPGNEVSELLNRLHERGLVKRAGRPGGKAVTWDLTEPLYRVWTQFRVNPGSQDLYQMLAGFVALLFSIEDIEKERIDLAGKIASLADDHIEKTMYMSRYRLIQNAYHERAGSTAETHGHIRSDSDGRSHNERKAVELFGSLNDAFRNGDRDHALTQLSALRDLGAAFPDDGNVRENLAKGLVNSIHYVGEAGDMSLGAALLQELRDLSSAFPNDGSLREKLAMGLFNAFYNAQSRRDRKQGQSLLSEMIALSSLKTEVIIDETVKRAVMIYAIDLIRVMKQGESQAARKGIRWLEAKASGPVSEIIPPVRLAMDVLEKGEEKAFAREPEEVKRVVRLLLEKSNKVD